MEGADGSGVARSEYRKVAECRVRWKCAEAEPVDCGSLLPLWRGSLLPVARSEWLRRLVADRFCGAFAAGQPRGEALREQ